MMMFGAALIYGITETDEMNIPAVLVFLVIISIQAYYFYRKIVIDPESRLITKTHLGLFKKSASLDRFINFEIVHNKRWGIFHNGYDIDIFIENDKGEEERFSILDNIYRKKKKDKMLAELQHIFQEIDRNDPTSKEYNLLPDEIMERLYDDHKGYTEEEIAATEKRLGITRLPAVLRTYYLNYAKLSLSTALDPILEPSQINFTHYILNNDREDFEDIYGAPVEELKARSTNHLVFWVENQGVWQAAIREEDLWRENPPVYMTVDESILEWDLVSDSLQSFLVTSFWDNAEDCDDLELEKSNDENEILSTIRTYHIDPALLTPTYTRHLATCWDSREKKLFMFLNRDGKGQFSDMKILSV